ncbi:MAG: hypothetical protein FWE21_04385 [Defluviitaleaceae bacterium]|nr:hypothetical protein [Defluviitaleaceae bacterium]
MKKKSTFLLTVACIAIGFAVGTILDSIDFGDGWIAYNLDSLIQPIFFGVAVLVGLVILVIKAKKQKTDIATAGGMRSWVYEYGGHTIVVKNTLYKLMLLIDGQEQDAIKGFAVKTPVLCLRGKIESGEEVIAIFEIEGVGASVSVIIGNAMSEQVIT